MVLYDASLPQQPEYRDDTADEMSAMLAVGKAISALQDPEARLRVLRWANERFNVGGDMLAAPAAFDDGADAGTDSSLSVDSLHSLFEPVAPQHDDNNHSARSWDDEIGDLFDEPIEPVVRRAELRVVARNDAPIAVAHEALQDLYDEPSVARQSEDDDPVANIYEHELDAVDGAVAVALDNDAIELLDQPLGPGNQPTAFHDDAVDLFDQPARLCLEETPQVEAAVQQDEPAAPQEEKSLDALLTDLVSSLESLTAQFQDVTA
jgi:hypothetical protein